MQLTLRSTLAIVSVLASLLLPIARLAPAQANDPFLGKWELDPEKSTFTPGPGPESRTMTLELTREGALHHIIYTPTVFAGVNFIEYTAKFDGKDYEIVGTGLDTVSLKRVDETTIDRVGKQGGKQTETCTLKLSADKKTLTMTTKGSFNGNQYASTQVYVRQ
jgi:hypothetical protein